MALELKSLIYISVARDDFTATDLADIHQVAMDLNALDGVTGLLLFALHADHRRRHHRH